jgi:phage terminase large subunit
MDLKTVDSYLNYKLDENDNYILLTFYELRVKLGLSQIDTNEFLNLSAIRLKNIGYDVYFTGQEYDFNSEHRIVKDNELLVAIKK